MGNPLKVGFARPDPSQYAYHATHRSLQIHTSLVAKAPYQTHNSQVHIWIKGQESYLIENHRFWEASDFGSLVSWKSCFKDEIWKFSLHWWQRGVVFFHASNWVPSTGLHERREQLIWQTQRQQNMVRNPFRARHPVDTAQAHLEILKTAQIAVLTDLTVLTGSTQDVQALVRESSRPQKTCRHVMPSPRAIAKHTKHRDIFGNMNKIKRNWETEKLLGYVGSADRFPQNCKKSGPKYTGSQPLHLRKEFGHPIWGTQLTNLGLFSAGSKNCQGCRRFSNSQINQISPASRRVNLGATGWTEDLLLHLLFPQEKQTPNPSLWVPIV